VEDVLDAVGAFDEFGGACPALVAWELSASELDVLPAWRRAERDRLLRPAGPDPDLSERLWRLTGKGWAARREEPALPASGSPDPGFKAPTLG
jgi:hypothetical protein